MKMSFNKELINVMNYVRFKQMKAKVSQKQFLVK